MDIRLLIPLPIVLDGSPIQIDEPNRVASQQPLPVDSEEVETGLDSSAHTRLRPATAARAAAASQPPGVAENAGTEIRTCFEQASSRAAAAAAPPRRFARPEEQKFSATGKKPSVSYAASLSAILQQHVGTVNFT